MTRRMPTSLAEVDSIRGAMFVQGFIAARFTGEITVENIAAARATIAALQVEAQAAYEEFEAGMARLVAAVHARVSPTGEAAAVPPEEK